MDDFYSKKEALYTWKTFCENVKHIEIGDGITSIGRYTFSECVNLESITIPDSVTEIGDSAFQNCKTLTSINIPSSVTNIGRDAFALCSNLIQSENGVSYVDRWVIGCDTSVTSVFLRSDTIGIGNYAFIGCSSLTSLTIPDCIKSIGAGAFAFCDNLKNINIPDSVIRIGEDALSGCSLQFQLDNGVSYFDNWAFWGVEEDIVLRDGTVGICDRAFAYSTIRSITLPCTLKAIGASAFANCGNPEVYFDGTKEEWEQIHIEPEGNADILSLVKFLK